MAALDNLLRVARALAPIREQRFVFAGASILPLLIDDPAAPPLRSTIDVDAVVDVKTYARWEYLQRRLADCDIRIRADSAAGKARHCLFHLGDLEVDIMPVRIPELGSPSRMLELGFDFAEPRELADDLPIFTLSAPAMLAAKLEAFAERGQREFPISDDLEDIIALLDGRVRLRAETSEAPAEMRLYIAAAIRRLLHDGHVLDLVSDHLRERERERRVLELMRTLSS